MRRKHKALLIGISDYNPRGKGGPDLDGCVNDTEDMRDALKACSFPSDTLRVIINENATKDNVLAHISWLLSDNNPGDSLVFFYSGHGSFVIRELPNRTVIKEQVIRPFESNKQITIQELAQRFARLHTDVHLEVFMDCCHSGPPDNDAGAIKHNEHQMVSRFIPPLFTQKFKLPAKANADMEVRRFFQPQIVLSSKLRHVLWTACKADQEAHELEIGKKIRGIFSYHLSSALRDTQGNIPRGHLDALVSQAISKSGFDQVPQLLVEQANADELIFT